MGYEKHKKAGTVRARAMLRRRVALAAAAICLALSLALGGVGLWAGNTIVEVMSNHLIRQMTESVHRRVDRMIEASSHAMSRAISDLARHEMLLKDPRALARELHALLDNEPEVDWLYLANEGGGLVSAGKLPDGKRVTLMTDGFRAGVVREFDASPDGAVGTLRKSGSEFDARHKEWYKRAKDSGTRYWTEPYLGSAEPILGISLSAPVFNRAGTFAGACGIDLILTRLSQFMQTLHLGSTGRAFIIDGSGQLIASSGGVMPVVAAPDGRELRLHGSGADDPVVRGAAEYLDRHPEIAEQASRAGMQPFSFDAARLGHIYGAVEHFRAPGGIAWTVVSALPASDFLGPVRRAAYLSLAIGVAIVGATLLLGPWGLGVALRPLTALTEAARAITRGEWPDVPETERNDEIGVLARAFHSMTARLKDTLNGLRQTEAYLSEAQRLSHTGSWALDVASDKYVYASEECLRIFEIDAQQGVPTRESVFRRIHPGDLDRVTADLETSLREKLDTSIEFRITLPSGTVKHVHASRHPVLNEAGEVVQLVGTVIDITDRKRAEHEHGRLRQLESDLAHINRVSVLGEMAASIAHEVGQPLAGVVSNGGACLRWLARDVPNVEEAREAANRIIRDGKRAGDIIARVRALTKKAATSNEVLALNETIQDVLALVGDEAKTGGVIVHTQFAGDLASVAGDRVQLQQVALNLLLNGIEAMSTVGDRARELVITTRNLEPDQVQVTVEDSGIGLGPAATDKIFDPFYSTKPNGMGMGLSICRSIVESHGGRLWATAKDGPGTMFHFTLPKSRAEASHA